MAALLLLTVALLMVLVWPSQPTGTAAASASAAQPTAAATPKAGPCDQPKGSSHAYARPHYFVYDAVVRKDHFGPEVTGRTAADVIEELRQRVCADPALLVDLVNHQKYGPQLTVGGPRRTAEIQRLIRHPRAWDQQVGRFIAHVQRGNPHLSSTNYPYFSWSYEPGASHTDIPRLTGGISGPQFSVFLIYEGTGGSRMLRLECGFQPSFIGG
jgi:hypothetical protein